MLIHNKDLCLGCKCCQIACMDAYNLPLQKSRLKITEEEEEISGKISLTFILKSNCKGCKNQYCIKACPVKALSIKDN
ncbi:carbon-monoxide dehydrogenase iron sulfur subunit/anaerobic dimethyl sulfoxide reductase subunit B (DMSO reductase iron-sulfur subunit) [Acetitomaculum ruminis DSM 5522]|uniref:Carbon-monoxide dehydrogenase iron sulfur subunit/anaerobic dimethyl sulfoxide reductase subunit B (DMSO reductase iron-sulfur subunit) n=1 Tax=Acetitomaculum ruminis DSM 5522 TaxID=1120918 RepID=A0A1I0XXF5_9FIRM|nr:hypothetical protein [Acetitomaculum ruminis]SFB05839.1 carbon-monoxide dehydrogenase iron sulfur subunit/anaerobic dimethyl sulfoxide reductase subunit B (DMSO reductase iron-sulfur subunit) [Acetitomaculum ruminis DSM 5522]